MSVAETAAIARRPAHRKEWNPLFPSDWVEKAFDPTLRAKRLRELRKNQVTVATNFYLMIWTVLAFCLVFALIAVGGLLFDQKQSLTSAPASLLVVPAVTLLISLVFIGITYLKTEIERTLLQIIDRLDSRDVSHA